MPRLPPSISTCPPRSNANGGPPRKPRIPGQTQSRPKSPLKSPGSLSVGGVNTNTNTNINTDTNTDTDTGRSYNSAQQRKMKEINAILSQPEIDLWALRELCLADGGLIDGEFV